MSTRSDRLSKYLTVIERGNKKVEKAADAKLLFEALCNQTDRLRCIERLVSCSNTLDEIGRAHV